MMRFKGGWLISSSGSQAVNAAAGMLTNVVYARNLQLDDVGYIAVINALGMFSTVFVDRGIGAWMTRALAAGEVSFQNTLIIILRAARPAIVGLVTITILMVLLDPVLPTTWKTVCIFSLLFIVCFWIFQVGLSFTQGLNLSGLRSIGVVLNGILTLGSTLLVFWFGGRLEAALMCTIAAYGTVGLLLIALSACSSNKPQPTQRRIHPVRAIRASRALFGSNVVTYAVSSGDVLLASIFLTPSQVGQYQIAKKVAQAAVLPLIASLPMVLGRMSAMTESKRIRFISRFIRLAVWGFSGILIAGSIVLPSAMPWLFGDAYSNITLITLMLAGAYQFQFLRDLLSVYANSRGLYTRSLLANILTAFTFLAMTALFGKTMSLILFAAVLVLSFLLGFALHLLLLHRSDRWERNDLARLIVPSCSLAICLLGVHGLAWLVGVWRA